MRDLDPIHFPDLRLLNHLLDAAEQIGTAIERMLN